MIPLFKVFMADTCKDEVGKVLASGYVGQGPKVDQFEFDLHNFLGTAAPPLTVNSGTSALDLAYHLIGIGSGDEVITTAMTCTATNNPLVLRGAKLVYADVNPYTGLIDHNDVIRKITSKTKAIVAVDWGGRSCNYRELKQQIGIPVVSDAAHAFGTKFHEMADYTCWSLQAIKHITTGDGGILMPPLEELQRGRLLRWFGFDRTKNESFRCSQVINEVGFKYQMNDIAAAIGIENLKHAERIVTRHRVNAEFYHGSLHGLKSIHTPLPDPYSAWWLYTLIMPSEAIRDRFIAWMSEKGIAASPVHARNDKHPPLRGSGHPLPGLDFFSSREVAIPVHWALTAAEREEIAGRVIEFDSKL